MSMRVQVAVPEHHIEQPVLDAALEAVTRLDEALIRSGEAPTFEQAVHRVRWQPEPPGQEHFDHAAQVLQRGHGDCDDLAPWHAASLRVTGVDPGAIATVYQSGPKRWHAVVQRSDGSVEDPSKAAGMGGRREGLRAASTHPLSPNVGSSVGSYMVRPQIALTPQWGQWRGRVDVPWNWQEEFEHGTPEPLDWAMTALHTAPTASTALVGAILGAVDLAETSEAGDPTHIQRLLALAAAAEGHEYWDIAGEFGPHDAGAACAVIGAVYGNLRQQMGYHPYVGDFGDFLREALPIAQDVLPGAASAIPIYGPVLGPVLQYGLDVAEKELNEGRTPKAMPMPRARREETQRATQQPQQPRPRAAPKAVQRGGTLCIPARWL